jgi:hypothetical protein
MLETGSSHEIAIIRPELVVEAIRRIVALSPH